MFDLKSIVEEKQNNSAAWIEGKQKEREEMNEMLTTGVELVTSDPEKYGQFMEKMGLIPHYSAGNNILIMQQCPDATRIGGMAYWNRQGRTISKGETSIKIFARENYDRHKQVQDINENTGEVSTRSIHLRGVGYNVQRVFDVKQTHGRDLPAPEKLSTGTDKMKQAIKALIESTKAQVQVDENLAVPARYEQDVMVVYVREGDSDNVLFQSLATEIAHANIHDGGNNPTYQRAD